MTQATILVVDDSTTVRHQLRACLEERGYSVVDAVDGAMAIDAVRESSPDLVIIDVHMPRLNGIAAIAEIRKLDGHAKTPIFVLTTESSPATAKLAKEAGATAWIVKPFNPEVLLRGVAKVLGA